MGHNAAFGQTQGSAMAGAGHNRMGAQAQVGLMAGSQGQHNLMHGTSSVLGNSQGFQQASGMSHGSAMNHGIAAGTEVFLNLHSQTTQTCVGQQSLSTAVTLFFRAS